jgi:hypothetical protein
LIDAFPFRQEILKLIIYVIILLPLVFLLGITLEKLDAYASVIDKIPHFNFAAVGDWDCTQNTEETVDNIIHKDPELIIGLGDYSYEDDTVDCWLEIVDPIDEKMKVVIADHETDNPEKLTKILDHFDLEEERYYYSLNFQNVYFVIMSDELRYDKGSKQYNFVRNDLARAAADPEIDWIIVAHHTQQYASTKNHIIHPVPEWAQTYHPLFEKYGVDLILQGNQHNYQRTYPINYNSDDPDYPLITERNTENYIHPRGQIFVTVGTGGAKLHSFEGKAPYIATKYTGYGILNLSIINEDDGASKGVTTLMAEFFGNDGKIRDYFTIEKPVS